MFINSIVKAGVTIHGIMKYVDDVNLIVAWVDLGTRWVLGNLVHTEEWELVDRLASRTRAEVTMEAMREAADEVIPWLHYTVDHPGLHVSKTVPMLDLQVWVRHPEEGGDGLEDHDTLGWGFLREAHVVFQVVEVKFGLQLEM